LIVIEFVTFHADKVNALPEDPPHNKQASVVKRLALLPGMRNNEAIIGFLRLT
jgi:hypothetical protein